MIKLQETYPTLAHEKAARAIVSYFQQLPETAAVLLVNSCARGRATPDSCLDVLVLVAPETLAQQGQQLNDNWQAFYKTDPHFVALAQAGRFAEVHLDIEDGRYTPTPRTIDEPADSFELAVGNHLAYSLVLWERSGYATQLKQQWLPYYAETLRQERLVQIQNACRHHLDHIPLYARRELYFAAFDRLYTGFQLFMQALFIAHSTYPIAYNKWIREQVEVILELPDLYRLLPGVLEVRPFISGIITSRAQELATLLELYTEKKLPAAPQSNSQN
jgi:predicted nucleotidyltransferase